MRQSFGGVTMRKVIEPQMTIGEISIVDIQFDLLSRDEIPKVLIGLQEICCDRPVREKAFESLKDLLPEKVSPDKGRKGMCFWTILVSGVLRLVCNRDYD